MLALSTTAMASGAVAPTHAPITRAEQALEALRTAYVEKNNESFFSSVSEEPYFKLVDLKFNLTSHFNAFSQMDWHLVRDNAVAEGSKVVIKTHWQKRMVRNHTGQVETSQGSTEFIFIVDEQARLLDFRGDNPF